jgi:hypothetical protein
MQDELGVQILSDFRDIYERQGTRVSTRKDAWIYIELLDVV